MIRDESSAHAWLRSLIEYDAAAAERIMKLVDLLNRENQVQNLVSRQSFDQIWRRHVADSAQLCCHVPRETSVWLDLGSGAGFPGLIVAILKSATPVVLVESRPLRGNWLKRASEVLALENVQIRMERAETLASFPAGVISARAFAPLARLLDVAERFSTSDTTWVLPKGRSARQELLQLQGWRHMFHVEQSLTDPDGGIIVGHLLGRKRAG